MSELRSVLDQLGSIDPDELSPEELTGEMSEAIYGQQRLEVLIAGWVKSISDRGGHTEMGYPNPTAMLTHLGRMSAGHATQVVSRANAADRAPTAYAAWADGRLSTDQTRSLFAAAEGVPGPIRPAVQDRLVLPLVVSAAEGEGVLCPDDERRPLAAGGRERLLQRVQLRR